MNSTKTFALLKTLNKKEIKLFKELVNNNKRKSLLVLLDTCLQSIKLKKNIDFKAFYELFYKKKYNKKDDNALRNELRLLNGLLEEFIFDIQVKIKSKENYYFNKIVYYEYLLERQELHLLNIELSKTFKRIDENEDYVYFHDFFLLWTKYSNSAMKLDAKFLEDTKEKFQDYFKKWQLEVGLKLRKFELFNAFIERSYYIIQKTLEFTDKKETLSFEAMDSNHYYNYLTLKTETYKNSGQKKINIINQSIEVLNKLKTNDLNIYSEKFVAHQFAGIEYLISGEIENALKSFAKSLEVSKHIDDKNLIKGLYNYASTLLKLEKYSEALSIYDDYKEIILKSNVKDMFSCIFTMCYIFIDNLNAAEKTNKIISSNSSVGNYIYSRCSLTVIHYLNGFKDLALNELVNIVQTVNYHKDQDKAHSDFANNFKNFINLTISKSFVKENQAKLIKLKEKLIKMKGKTSLHYGSNSLHLQWLIKEVESKIST